MSARQVRTEGEVVIVVAGQRVRDIRLERHDPQTNAAIADLHARLRSAGLMQADKFTGKVECSYAGGRLALRLSRSDAPSSPVEAELHLDLPLPEERQFRDLTRLRAPNGDGVQRNLGGNTHNMARDIERLIEAVDSSDRRQLRPRLVIVESRDADAAHDAAVREGAQSFQLDVEDRVALQLPFLDANGTARTLVLATEPTVIEESLRNLAKTEPAFRNALHVAKIVVSTRPLYDLAADFGDPLFVINATTSLRKQAYSDSNGRAALLPMNVEEFGELAIASSPAERMQTPLVEGGFEPELIARINARLVSYVRNAEPQWRPLGHYFAVSFGSGGGLHVTRGAHSLWCCFTSIPSEEGVQELLENLGLNPSGRSDVGAGDATASILTLFNALPADVALPSAALLAPDELHELAVCAFVGVMSRLVSALVVNSKHSTIEHVPAAMLWSLMRQVGREALRVAKQVRDRHASAPLPQPVLSDTSFGVRCLLWGASDDALPPATIR